MTNFAQLGPYYVLMFGAARIQGGECAPYSWPDPLNVIINLSTPAEMKDPDEVVVVLCSEVH